MFDESVHFVQSFIIFEETKNSLTLEKAKIMVCMEFHRNHKKEKKTNYDCN